MRLRLGSTLAICLSAFAACCLGSSVHAQSAAVPRPPVELSKVSYAFATAASSGDAEAAAKLSRFPLDNIVYREPKTISRPVFIKRFKADYAGHKEIVDCLLANQLEVETQNGKTNFRKWSIDCNGNVYHFGFVGDHWAYTGYENVNE